MENWIQTNLNELCEINMGQSPPSSTYNTDGVGLPFFQGKAEFTELHPSPVKWCSHPNRIAKNNDILISVRAPVGATNIANQECCIGRGLAAIRYPQCNKYVFYYLRLIEKNLDKKGTGTTFRAISGQVLRNEIIPIAPLPEQRAIVAKIERLFSELDDGIASLKKAQEQLKIYRQAVLKKAFEGELTKKWRESQASLPSAQELLDQIKKEREVVAKTNGKSKPIKPLTESELAKLPKLPSGWAWIKHAEVSVINPSKPEADDALEVTFLPMPLVKEETGEYSLSKSKKFAEVKKGYTSFLEGDVIFAKITPCMENGKAAYLEELTNGIGFGSTEFHVSRPVSKIYGLYIFYYLIRREFRKEAKRNMTGSAGQLRVPTNYFSDHPIPICSFEEQHQIVQEIETRLSVCDNIEANIKEALFKTKALRQSILKKAFEGKLLDDQELKEVRRAPDWESANQLLERIKSSRGSEKGSRTSGKVNLMPGKSTYV